MERLIAKSLCTAIAITFVLGCSAEVATRSDTAATTPKATPGATSGHCLAYMPNLGGVAIVGGDTRESAHLWVLKGSDWQKVKGKGLERSLPAVAYDSDRNLIVVQGGAKPTYKADGNADWQPTSETWTFDGKDWKLASNKGPAPRDHNQMVYDSGRKRIVMFGGSDADPSGRSVIFGDTWEWDGQTWTKVSDTGPIARCHHAMAYDPIRKRVVLAGGFGEQGRVDSQTWEWDGKTWSSKNSPGPSMRTSPRMVFDPSFGKIVLFGGEAGRDNLPTDTWTWDGSSWSKIATAGPPGRTVHALAYDPERKAIVLYKGTMPDPVGDLWTFSEGRWKQIP